MFEEEEKGIRRARLFLCNQTILFRGGKNTIYLTCSDYLNYIHCLSLSMRIKKKQTAESSCITNITFSLIQKKYYIF